MRRPAGEGLQAGEDGQGVVADLSAVRGEGDGDVGRGGEGEVAEGEAAVRLRGLEDEGEGRGEGGGQGQGEGGPIVGVGGGKDCRVDDRGEEELEEEEDLLLLPLSPNLSPPLALFMWCFAHLVGVDN